MNENFSVICDRLVQDSGIVLLRNMRELYVGRGLTNIPEQERRRFLREGTELGLLIPRGENYALSESGFLIGNVAKEYCNWLDNGRKMPMPRPPREFIDNKDILDLGCSIGRWLWEFQPYSKSVMGLELRPEYIEIGNALARRENFPVPKIFPGCIEQVDQMFPPESADFVFCRLVLNYVCIRKTLSKIVALLKDRGVLWVLCESFQGGWTKMCLSHGIKPRVYNSFGLINSLVCELTGTQLNFRYRGRHQVNHRAAYPSRRWWKSTFEDMGLESHITDAGEGTFCIWGTKLPAKHKVGFSLYKDSRLALTSSTCSLSSSKK